MDFVPAIVGLRNANTNEVIARLHKVFKAITEMNDDQVIVAYQTLDTTAEMLNLPRPRLQGGKPTVVACPMSDEQHELQAWPLALTLGQSLPTLPLWLRRLQGRSFHER